MPSSSGNSHDANYVLMTAAHNEERNIEATIRSVCDQTVRPSCWVIVSDNSTDRTNEIVAKYASRYEFLRIVKVTRPPGRSFGAKIAALRQTESFLTDVPHDFIGNLDADITLAPTYFQDLMQAFEKNDALGIASGFVYEEERGEFRSRKNNSRESVPHCAQLVRSQVYESIGGYAALKYGGEDWHAQISAEMKGWTAEAFPSFWIHHHRRTGSGGKLLQNWFREGRMDYSLGSHPVFEVFKCIKRMRGRYLLGAVVRLAGFSWCYLCREQRPVSNDFVTFIRTKQKARLHPLS